MTKRLTALLFAFMFYLSASADTFIVTSNADSGVGTLREAITMANANGTILIDYIHFNLPDISVSGRRITLTWELPDLTSHIIIDGSTQPGEKFGVSDAKVELYFSFSTTAGFNLRRMVKIYGQTNIGIYGLKFTDNITWTTSYKETVCIRIENSSNIEIGNAGKGNVFTNWVRTISAFANPNSENDNTYNKNINIYSNFFGLHEDGITPSEEGDAMQFIRVENLNVGNLDPVTGNVIAASRKRIEISTTKGNILIANNKIGTNYLGTEMLSKPYGEASRLYDNIYVGNYSYYNELELTTELRVINNLSTGYCRGGVYIFGLGKKFYVQGNKIGTDITGTKRLSPLMDYGVWVEHCRSGIIGVEGDEVKEKNIIAFAQRGSGAETGLAGSAVAVANCEKGITISRNSIFCDRLAGISISNGGAYQIPKVTINSITATTITGTAPPLSKIEIFKDDSCINCEGKIFFDSTYANENGQWTKVGINTSNIVVTATDTGRMTSEFSKPWYEVNNFQLTNAICGEKTGSITGLKITSGTWWHWEDEFGEIVSRDSSLRNVGPGNYRLVIGIGYNSCELRTRFFNVLDLKPPEELNTNIFSASCGQNNGGIIAYFDEYNFEAQWLNSAGELAGTGKYLINALPGNYYLELSVFGSCKKKYGPLIVKNQSGPTLNTNNVQITPAACGNNTGSIKGITFTGAQGTPTFQWVDSMNNIAGYDIDLVNAYPGKYRLQFKDDGGCETITTSYYSIGNSGELIIDTTGMNVSPSKCSGISGVISHIKVTGGDNYEWRNMASNAVFANTLDVFNLPDGYYQLTVTNNSGCNKTSPVIHVPQAKYQGPGLHSFISKLAFCGKANGSLEPVFRGDTSSYQFRWVDSANNQTISNYTKAFNIYGGTYQLYVKDSNDCELVILHTVLRNAPIPSFDYSNMVITPDNCMEGRGSINGIKIYNLFNDKNQYTWLNNVNNTVGSTTTVKNLTANDYQLKVTDDMGCTVMSKPITVNNVNTSLPNPLYEDITILRNTTAELKVKNMQQGLYELYDNPSGPMIASNSTGIFTTSNLSADKTYYIRFVSGVCSSNAVPVKVAVVDKTIVYIPTAFTPNQDGKNDVLRLIPYGAVKLQYFTIYNRWGKVVFNTTSFNNAWNGTFNGQILDAGVFVWIMRATDELSGLIIEQKGTVTLIR